MENIVVIGSGMAGLTAAIKCAQNQKNILLVSAGEPARSQSVMAMGGINAALDMKGEHDSTEQHFEDTMKAACWISDKESVKKLTSDAPDIIKWLDSIGVNFSRDSEQRVDVRRFGGQKKMRTAYAGARTGKQIMTSLISQVRRYEAAGQIKTMFGWRLADIVIKDKSVCGVILMNHFTQEIKRVEASALILAFGAPNGIFGKTTGSAYNDGTAGGISFERGLEFQNLEMIQYHPTTVDGGAKRILITEAARGQGGRLFIEKDGKPWYFMEEWYPEGGNLMPRDVVSRGIYKVCKENNLNEVYLDVTHISLEDLNEKLDEVVSTCHIFLDLDPHKKPIPVYPGIHYFMGGIKTDSLHQTNIKGIFAAGECSSQYHGANRLGGNSTLGAIHGGMISAKMACEYVVPEIKDRTQLCEKAESELKEKIRSRKGKTGYSPLLLKKELANIMNSSMAIMRNEEELLNALNELKKIEEKLKDCSDEVGYYGYMSTVASVHLAQGFIYSALERKESRGAHQRTDFPKTRSEYEGNIIALWENGKISVRFGE